MTTETQSIPINAIKDGLVNSRIIGTPYINDNDNERLRGLGDLVTNLQFMVIHSESEKQQTLLHSPDGDLMRITFDTSAKFLTRSQEYLHRNPAEVVASRFTDYIGKYLHDVEKENLIIAKTMRHARIMYGNHEVIRIAYTDRGYNPSDGTNNYNIELTILELRLVEAIKEILPEHNTNKQKPDQEV